MGGWRVSRKGKKAAGVYVRIEMENGRMKDEG